MIFLDTYVIPTAIIVAQILAIVVPLLVAVAYLTYFERKVIAAMQLRKGPNVVGPFGLLQPFADGVKLLAKETILPSGANKVIFLAAPMLTFILSLIAWAVIPFDAGMVLADINVGVLYLFAISSLGVYGVIMAGWASNSKYAFLGALRSAAQMVSYEVSIGFVIITVLLCVGSLNLSDVVEAQRTVWFAIPLLPMFVIFFVSALAETNRAPFDLPEGGGDRWALRRAVFDKDLDEHRRCASCHVIPCAAAAPAGEQYVAVMAPAEVSSTTSPSHPLRWHAQSASSSEHATFEQATPISPHFQSSDNVAAETLAGSTRHLSHAAHWAQSAGGGGTAGAGATGAGTAVRRQSCTSEASLPSTAAASPSRLTSW